MAPAPIRLTDIVIAVSTEDGTTEVEFAHSAAIYRLPASAPDAEPLAAALERAKNDKMPVVVTLSGAIIVNVRPTHDAAPGHDPAP